MRGRRRGLRMDEIQTVWERKTAPWDPIAVAIGCMNGLYRFALRPQSTDEDCLGREAMSFQPLSHQLRRCMLVAPRSNPAQLESIERGLI